jgi:hypothetical protein
MANIGNEFAVRATIAPKAQGSASILPGRWPPQFDPDDPVNASTAFKTPPL